jgi:Helicase HerA, central domain
VSVALRNSDFQFKPKSKTSRQIGELVQAGGRIVVLEERQLRAVTAVKTLVGTPGFLTWKAANRPLTHLAFVRAILDLDSAPRPVERMNTQPIPEPRRPAKPAPDRTTGQLAIFDPQQVRIGVSTLARKEPVQLAVDAIAKHVAVLGSSGSGKTTAALNLVEQLLERGISALLVDRKGDLARYADAAWWEGSDLRRRLRDRIDVALYTPGAAHGRPLRIPVIPALADATTQDRDQLARFAAGGLAAMMGYGSGSTFQKKLSVLQCAIQLHADEREVTLELLRETINRPDPELLAAVGPLQRYFAQLAEDLQTLGIQRGSLLASDGPALDVAEFFPTSGKPRLTILSTAALAEVSVLQFWVSRLLIELGRLARTRPSKALQGVAFFDEADAYVPAVGSPPTKEPMFDLLKRARSAGLGIVLATQNPADFDYKARDLVNTWMIGKITQDRALEKMRNLLAGYPNIGPRIATQPAGHFCVLGSGIAEVKGDPAMLVTEQLSEAEILELARRQ